MSYSVEYSKNAIKELEKLDKSIRNLIVKFIDSKLIGCSDPRSIGKALERNHKGKWRYRVGDYRIIAEIMDNKIIIMVLSVGHRGSVYKS